MPSPYTTAEALLDTSITMPSPATASGETQKTASPAHNTSPTNKPRAGSCNDDGELSSEEEARVSQSESPAVKTDPTPVRVEKPDPIATTQNALPRKLSVAALVRSFSPRSRAKQKEAEQKEKDGEPTETKKPKTPVVTFGKLKRSSLKVPTSPQSPQQIELTGNGPKLATPASVSKWKQTVNAVVRDADRLRIQIPPPPPSDQPDRRSSCSSNSVAAAAAADPAFTSGPGSFVDEVRTTLFKLLTTLDAIDPRKLSAIRLGGELRGLLGKAQDEFQAYELAFRDHAGKVGVAIALQNFAASLHQVFPIVERLQTAKFLLNRQFKRDVTFAFQEINSYYTSMFMELSMSVAQTAGLVLPLPTPIKPLVEPTSDKEEDEDDAPVEEVPPAPTGDDICLEAHQYFFGHGCQVDLSRALELYKEAALLGNPIAMRCLGHMYMQGSGAERDLFVAEKWLAQAATGGDTEAVYLLGCLLCDTAPHQKTDHLKQEQTARAQSQFTLAGERGHRDAQFRLASLLETDVTIVDKSDRIRLSLPWYRRAAEQNHSKAQAALGRLLLLQHDTTGSPDTAAEAIHWLQRAATAGEDADALTLLGVVYTTGRGGVKKDVNRGLAFLQRAASGGNLEAMLHLARLLLSGRRSSVDASTIPLQDHEDTHDEAVRLLLNSAHGGVVDALYEVGELLYESQLLRDRTAALRFFIKAAQAKPPHALAAKRAANMVYSGTGCKTDKWQAHRFYTIAADTGDAEALNALGLMYEDGDGCDLDFAHAAACYRRAVELGSAHAHFNLGCLLAHGKGVGRNLEAAQAHFHKAVALGYALAKDFIRPEN